MVIFYREKCRCTGGCRATPKVLPTDMAKRLGRERKAPKGSMVHQLKLSLFESRWYFAGSKHVKTYTVIGITYRITLSYFGGRISVPAILVFTSQGARTHGESCSVMSWCHVATVATSCYRVATKHNMLLVPRSHKEIEIKFMASGLPLENQSDQSP